MGNKNIKQNEKTLKQLYEEINEKISATKEKREAFLTAADEIKKDSYFLTCCQQILEKFNEVKFYDGNLSLSLYFELPFPPKVLENNLTKEYFSEELQKVLNEYSPEKLQVTSIRSPLFSYNHWCVDVTLA